MRLLVVTHAYPRFDGDVAGNFLERLCRALVDAHAIEVLAPSDQGRGGRERRHGIPVERLRYAAPGAEVLAYRGTMTDAARSLRGLRSFAGLVSAFRNGIVERGARGAADLVHAHWWLPAGIAAWRARRAGRLPYVVTLHGTDVAVLERSAVARTLARRVLRAAARVTTVSSWLARRTAAACGLPEEAILVQPMPLALPTAPPPPSPAETGGLRLLTVGRLSAQKRVELVLEAARRLRDRATGVRCTIVGDGPRRAALEARAAELGLGTTVRFVGAVPAERVGEYLGDADVFVIAAEGEGFGLAAVEALAHGVPVVACTDGGGLVEIVTEAAGRVVPPVPAALADAVLALARDRAARAQAAAAGAAWRHRLDPDAVAARFTALYHGVLEGR